VASLTFSGGDVIEQLVTRKAGDGDRKQGTTVRVWPDAKSGPIGSPGITAA
jgi:topoisomerase-4 subunit B